MILWSILIVFQIFWGMTHSNKNAVFAVDVLALKANEPPTVMGNLQKFSRVYFSNCMILILLYIHLLSG